MTLRNLNRSLPLWAATSPTGLTHINKFGENEVITADTEEDVWDGGGTYSFPTTAVITKLSQTADQEAMRGATIEVQGLDGNWALTTQTKDLNATLTTTAVTLDTPLIRVFRMKVLANVVGASPIRAHNTAENADYAIISIGNNQTLMAIYTIPAGKTGYMTNYYGDTVDVTNKTPTSSEFHLWAADRANSYEFQLKSMRAIGEGGKGFQHEFNPYYKFTEKTDIKISAGVVDEDGHIHAGFDIILIDN